LWAQLSPFTLTGVVTDPRFEGSISLIDGDFGAVFQGSYEGMFQGCLLGNLMPGNETIVLNTTNAASMFARASSSDWSFVRRFDVSKVTNFSFMFRDTSDFNQPLASWDGFLPSMATAVTIHKTILYFLKQFFNFFSRQMRQV
jgi:hypothetical protein